MKGWSEGTASLREAMDEAGDGDGVKAGFFARLDPRCKDWALRMLRSAHVLKGAGNVDWKTFAGTAKAALDWTAGRWRRSPSCSMSGRERTGSWRTRNCYEGPSKRMVGMTGKRLAAPPSVPGTLLLRGRMAGVIDRRRQAASGCGNQPVPVR